MLESSQQQIDPPQFVWAIENGAPNRLQAGGGKETTITTQNYSVNWISVHSFNWTIVGDGMGAFGQRFCEESALGIRHDLCR